MDIAEDAALLLRQVLVHPLSPAPAFPPGDGYIPMSPVGSMSLSSSLEKTATPSSAADMGYLTMEPQGATAAVPCTTARLAGFASCSSPTVVHTGFPTLAVPPAEYMDMAPLSSSLPKSGERSVPHLGLRPTKEEARRLHCKREMVQEKRRGYSAAMLQI